MPPLSTHFRFATLVMPSLGSVSQVGSFLLGTTAPDAFEPDSEDSFSQHHFKGGDGRISLQEFLKETNFIHQPYDNPAWSFICGYYSHLWLDIFYRDNADSLSFKKPIGMPDTDLRDLIRRETEILNAPFVLDFGNLPLPQSEDLLLPTGLEFVELERCIYLFSEVLKQSQAWSQLASTSKTIDEAEYATFLRDAAKLFTNEIQTAA